MSDPGGGHSELAVAWVAHLRDGGTTPWRRWTRRSRADDAADRSRHGGPRTGTGDEASAIPGAAQLELLRRLNELGPLPHRVDHVLTRSGPGRGPVHLPLSAGVRAAPPSEVVRVAAGVLADLTAELPVPRESRRRRTRRPQPVEGLPAFALEGPPITVAELDARLAAAGIIAHRPRFSWRGARADPGPEVVVVVAAPLDEAMREVWASRVQRGAARPWPRFVSQWAGRQALPPAPALDRTVNHWTSRLGAGHVHVVVAEPGADLAMQVAQLLGRSLQDQPAIADRGRFSQLRCSPEPVRLPPAVVEVLRRVNVVLPFVSSSTEKQPRLTALVRLARQESAAPEPPDLPQRHRDWLGASAERIADALHDSGCLLHGDVDSLRTLSAPTGRRVDGGEVLDVMVRMIHRVDAELPGKRRRGRGGR